MLTKSEIEFHIQNLRVLIEAVQAQPETNFDLNNYSTPHPQCGTLYCTMGLATTLPHFRDLGLYLADGFPVLVEKGVRPKPLDAIAAAEELFGEFTAVDVAGNSFVKGAFRFLFEPFEQGHWDHRWRVEGMTHKELALKRLEKALRLREGQLAGWDYVRIAAESAL